MVQFKNQIISSGHHCSVELRHLYRVTRGIPGSCCPSQESRIRWPLGSDSLHREVWNRLCSTEDDRTEEDVEALGASTDRTGCSTRPSTIDRTYDDRSNLCSAAVVARVLLSAAAALSRYLVSQAFLCAAIAATRVDEGAPVLSVESQDVGTVPMGKAPATSRGRCQPHDADMALLVNGGHEGRLPLR